MKTTLKILGILIVLVIALAILLPIIFKGKIIEMAKQAINKTVKTKVDFGDVGLSVFMRFPCYREILARVSIIHILLPKINAFLTINQVY